MPPLTTKEEQDLFGDLDEEQPTAITDDEDLFSDLEPEDDSDLFSDLEPEQVQPPPTPQPEPIDPQQQKDEDFKELMIRLVNLTGVSKQGEPRGIMESIGKGALGGVAGATASMLKLTANSLIIADKILSTLSPPAVDTSGNTDAVRAVAAIIIDEAERNEDFKAEIEGDDLTSIIVGAVTETGLKLGSEFIPAGKLGARLIGKGGMGKEIISSFTGGAILGALRASGEGIELGEKEGLLTGTLQVAKGAAIEGGIFAGFTASGVIPGVTRSLFAKAGVEGGTATGVALRTWLFAEVGGAFETEGTPQQQLKKELANRFVGFVLGLSAGLGKPKQVTPKMRAQAEEFGFSKAERLALETTPAERTVEQLVLTDKIDGEVVQAKLLQIESVRPEKLPPATEKTLKNIEERGGVLESVDQNGFIEIEHFSSRGDILTEARPTSFFREKPIDLEMEFKDSFEGSESLLKIRLPAKKIYQVGSGKLPAVDKLVGEGTDFVNDTRGNPETFFQADKSIISILKENFFEGFSYPKEHRFANEIVILDATRLKRFSSKTVSREKDIELERQEEIEALPELDLETDGVSTGERQRLTTIIKNMEFEEAFETTVTKKNEVVRRTVLLKKMRLTPEQLKDMNRRLNVLDLDFQEIKSFKDMERGAEALGLLSVRDFQQLAKNSPLSSDQSLALRGLIKDLSDKVVETSKKIKELDIPDDDLVNEQRLAEAELDLGLTTLMNTATEAGRAVVAFRIYGKLTLEPSFWLAKARKMTGKDLTPDQVTSIMEMISAKNRSGLANFLSMLRIPSLAEKAVTLWKAGLLTNPSTHISNITGNVSMAILESASDFPSTALDVMISWHTGQRTTTFAPLAKLKGVVPGLKAGAKFAGKGIYPVDLLAKYDITRQVRFKSKPLDTYVQAVFRSLGSADILFREMAMTESFEKSAIVIAKNEGLIIKNPQRFIDSRVNQARKVAELNAKTKEGISQERINKAVQKAGKRAETIAKKDISELETNFKKRVGELLIEPTNHMQKQSINDAEFQTFQSKNVIADAISGAKSVSPAMRTFIDVIVPFTQTPTNVAARMADFSPLGLVRLIANQVQPVTRGQKSFVKDTGRILTGSGMIVLGNYLAKEGIITGNAPRNRSERQDFLETKRPNSLRIGNTFFRLDKTSPVGNLLTLGADHNESSKTKKGAELFLISDPASALQALSEQTFVKGASKALNVAIDPERHTRAFINQMAGSVVPAIVGGVTRAIDPELKGRGGMAERITSRVPFVSKGIPPAVGVFGDIIKRSTGKIDFSKPLSKESRRALISFFDPFQTITKEQRPLLEEANRVGVSLGVPSNIVKSLELTPEEYFIYQTYRGKELKKLLDTTFKQDFYKGTSFALQNAVVRSMKKQATDRANILLFPALMRVRYNLRDKEEQSFMLGLGLINGTIELDGFSDDEKTNEIVNFIVETTRSDEFKNTKNKASFWKQWIDDLKARQ